MRKLTRIRRSVRAISPVISVLLMIAIAVAASLVAYAWVMGYMDFTTTKVGKAIKIQSVSNSPAVYVQNVGDSDVTLKSCYINGVLDSAATTLIEDELLTKSSTYTIDSFTDTAAFSAKQVTVKIVTTDGISAEYTETFSGSSSSTPPATPYDVTFILDTGGGSMTPAPGTQSVGGTISVSATPAEDYEFDQWESTGSIVIATPTSASTTATINGAGTITATFTYSPTLYAVDFILGTGGDSLTPGDGNYAGVIAIEAFPAEDYEFNQWQSTGSITFGDAGLASTTATINGAGTITATFTYVPPEPETLILRPDEDGDYEQLAEDYFTLDNWQCVDDTGSGDGSNTYVYDNDQNNYDTDTYRTENHGSASGTINSVTVYIRCERSGSDTCHGRAILRMGSTNYYNSQTFNLASSWTLYSTTFYTNPAGGAWTWSAIDSLEYGVSLESGDTSGGGRSYARCTQVYVEVNYTP